MENITDTFKETYTPKKALLIYQNGQRDNDVFVEAYDINRQGRPVNAHPLSLHETMQLAECLNTSVELNNNYLKSTGLTPDNILHIKPGLRGEVIWYTPEQEVNLFFAATLHIPCGKAFVPPLIWKANKNSLQLFACKSRHKPTGKTPLFRAPFFNTGVTGHVCMGTVETDLQYVACLEDFTARWEHCYWNSYFSHLNGGSSPVQGNIVQLWQRLVNSHQQFPLDVLITAGKLIKDLIV